MDVLLVSLLFAAAGYFFELMAVFIALSHHLDGLSFATLRQSPKAVEVLVKDVRVSLPAQLGAYLVGWWGMARCARGRHHMRFFSAIRWQWPRGRWFTFAFGGAVMWLGVSLLSRVLPIPKGLPIEEAFSTRTAAWMLAIFAVAIAPFMEEMFFRGLLYPALKRRTGEVIAILLTALFFALLHSAQLANSWGPLLVLFLVGVVLTLVRSRTGSVAASLLVHIGYNAAIFVAMFVVTGGFRHLERMK